MSRLRAWFRRGTATSGGPPPSSNGPAAAEEPTASGDDQRRDQGIATAEDDDTSKEGGTVVEHYGVQDDEAPRSSRVEEKEPISELGTTAQRAGPVEDEQQQATGVEDDGTKQGPETGGECHGKWDEDEPQAPRGGDNAASSERATTVEQHGRLADEKQQAAQVDDRGVNTQPATITEHYGKEGQRDADNEPADRPVVTTVNAEGEEEAEVEEDADDESKYLSGTKLGLLTFGLLLATFVVALDNTIIATAIPVITTKFHALDDVGWYGSAYLLTTTSLQPFFGKIYTYFDVKWVYISALAIFELGSVLCAAATGSTMLIVGRAVAGSGAAALFSGAMTIIAYSVPLRRRALYIALLSSMFGIASVVGPILGGAFTTKVSWRWCFWINLPFGGISILVVFLFFSNPPRRYSNLSVKEKLKMIDIAGAFILICAIVCLLLALQWGGSRYPWHDSRVWGCLLGFGLIIIVFIALQFYLGDRATMPPRILKQRTVGACALFSAFLAMALYTHIYYLPFYFQAVKGVDAEASGIRTIPYLVSVTNSTINVGAAITFLGPYNPPMYTGSIIFVIGCGLLYTLKVTSSIGTWVGYQILAGFGAGACVQIPFIAVQVVLPEKDMPVGNAVAIFFNTLGGAISVSIAQNIFTNTLIKQLPVLAPGANAAEIIAAGATHVRLVTPPRLLPGVLAAFDKANTTAFIMPIAVSGLAFLASLLMEWKSVKGRSLIPGGGA